jgi:hypothetical protein
MVESVILAMQTLLEPIRVFAQIVEQSGKTSFISPCRIAGKLLRKLCDSCEMYGQRMPATCIISTVCVIHP